MDTLSVCIIAKNEEKKISKCLKSVQDIADEIIIVDTGSTDDTINISKEFNAKVIEFPWENDFSSARNKALESASKDWLLFIDCDEALDNTQIFSLKDSLQYSNYLGFRLELINVIDNKPYKGDYLLRIIKNNSGFYFSGKINEKLKNHIYKDSFEDKIFDLEFLIYNFGYDYTNKALNKRCNRNLSIYSSYSEEKKDYLFYYNLGNEYFLLNNPSKAVDNYLKSLYLNDNLFINSYIVFSIIKTYYKVQKFNKAILIGEHLLDKYNAFREIYLLLALCYEKINNIEKSKEYFKLYLRLHTKGPPYCFNLNYMDSKDLLPEMFGFKLESFKNLT